MIRMQSHDLLLGLHRRLFRRHHKKTAIRLLHGQHQRLYCEAGRPLLHCAEKLLQAVPVYAGIIVQKHRIRSSDQTKARIHSMTKAGIGLQTKQQNLGIFLLHHLAGAVRRAVIYHNDLRNQTARKDRIQTRSQVI